MNHADRETEKRLKKLEKRITAEYSKAQKELDRRASSYFKNLRARWKAEYEKYLAGQYTQDQWERWQMTQIARGERYEQMKRDMAHRIVQASETATAYINDDMPGIFSLNANFSAYEIWQQTGAAFNIYNEEAVKRLIADNPALLPSPAVDIPKAMKWNMQKLQSAVISGILTGKPIMAIAGEFANVTDMSRKAAIRNARTAYTGAQNAGRQDTFERSHNIGIELEKEWIATLDSRTRDSHQALDGCRVPYDDLFPNGLEFPGDPNGEPAEVYNCRCTMRAIIPKYNGGGMQRIAKDAYGDWQYVEGVTYRGRGGSMSYEEWLKRS